MERIAANVKADSSLGHQRHDMQGNLVSAADANTHKLSLGLEARCLHLRILGCNNSTNKACGLTSQCSAEPSFLTMFLNRPALFADSFEIVWFGFWFLVALLRRNLTLTSTQLN